MSSIASHVNILVLYILTKQAFLLMFRRVGNKGILCILILDKIHVYVTYLNDLPLILFQQIFGTSIGLKVVFRTETSQLSL